MQSNGIFEPIVHFPVKTAPIFAYCFNYVLICTLYFCCADFTTFYLRKLILYYNYVSSAHRLSLIHI